MQILSISEANKVIGTGPLAEFVEARAARLEAASFAIPADSGRKNALATLISRLLGSAAPVVLWITGWGVWPSSENWDLFYRYRGSLGEARKLIDAPIHVVGAAESDILASLLAMVLFFSWDAQLMSTTGELIFTISHDEWLELRAPSVGAHNDVVQALQRFGLSRLAVAATDQKGN